ncbi:hypothetical protein L9F63_000165, partial [Diploptera punctata]
TKIKIIAKNKLSRSYKMNELFILVNYISFKYTSIKWIPSLRTINIFAIINIKLTRFFVYSIIKHCFLMKKNDLHHYAIYPFLDMWSTPSRHRSQSKPLVFSI